MIRPQITRIFTDASIILPRIPRIFTDFDYFEINIRVIL